MKDFTEGMQTKIEQRYIRLSNCNHVTWKQTVQVSRNWILQQRELNSILLEANALEPTLDVESWVATVIRSRGRLSWTHQTEHGLAILSWAILNHIADSDGSNQVLIGLSGESSLDQMILDINETFIKPVFEYLAEHVGETSSTLYALERYIRLIEWFDREELAKSFEADTGKGEEIYNKHMRRFLFTEGLEMPLSEVASPSGESDALSNLGTEDPLVCELKLFDGIGRGREHVASGLTQALHYALDHGKTVAYLVIINLSGRPLDIPSDSGSKSSPPYLDIAGVRIFLIIVRGIRTAAASKIGKSDPVKWKREDLINGS